ncbi:MAG: PadR family transcriptional regulator [Marinomonas sp.]
MSGEFGGGIGGGRRRGGRGAGRRRTRMFGQGELRLALLHLIAEQTRHGYELIKAIEELTGGAYAPSPGAVYPTLSLMVDEAVISEAASEGARKNFAITKEGSAELDVRAEEVAALLERLTAHGEDAQGPSSPDLFRAMGNLTSVLKNRARSGGLGKETLDQIVDLIDEMAKKIERL